MKKKYLIIRDIDYYPFISDEFIDFNDAKKCYMGFLSEYKDGKIFLCKIIIKNKFK